MQQKKCPILKKMNQPNIFNYATSELSQDALIAWLLVWANDKYKKENTQLNQLGVDFLQSLLIKQNIVITKISNLEIILRLMILLRNIF